ncbi:hypothetical protein GCM10020358_24080 [Amorphoplanes nipponensis]|uniref:Uncharacterized protein n=1 Tax=Actinoplanes nipponensis TaxID=135950 RepID=A0A919JQE6_9ACTN|nr:hypothetical protein Ani05nite_45880 [Actinoplanes nipponensis]
MAMAPVATMATAAAAAASFLFIGDLSVRRGGAVGSDIGPLKFKKVN